MGTCFAQAIEQLTKYAPWAAPGVPMKALKWIFQRHSPLALKPDGTLWQLLSRFYALKSWKAAAHFLADSWWLLKKEQVRILLQERQSW